MYFLTMALSLTFLAVIKYIFKNAFVSFILNIITIGIFILFMKFGKRFFTFKTKAAYTAIIVESLYTKNVRNKGMVSRGENLIIDFFGNFSDASLVDSQSEKAIKESK